MIDTIFINKVEIMHQLIEKLLQYCEQRQHLPLRKGLTPEQLKSQLGLALPSRPQTAAEIEKFVDDYLSHAVNTSHPLYCNQLWSQTHSISAIGEFISALSNTSMYTYEVAPVATLLEREMVAYLSKLIWPQDSAPEGLMTSGGSASNLQALLCARNKKFPESKEEGLHTRSKATILVAKNAHYSLKRAANILGIGHQGLVEVPVNDSGQMCANALEEALAQLTGTPFAVVSTAGTTVEGSYDNFQKLGDICSKHGLWFHIDGAYGASVLLSKKHQDLMKGVA